MAQRITLRILLEHIQAMKYSLEKKIDEGNTALQRQIDQLAERMDRINRNFNSQMDTIDGRLDELEIREVEQKHEQRITRLERKTGLTAQR